MNNYRILKNGEKAQELETAMEIIIKTKFSYLVNINIKETIITIVRITDPI